MGTCLRTLFHPQDPDTVYALNLNGGGVWKSLDGGASDWIEINNGIPPMARSIFSGTINPNSPNELWIAAMGAGIYKTTDGGANWVAKNNGLTSLFTYSVESDPQNPSVLYSGTSDGLISKSTDGAENWTCLNTGSPFPCGVWDIAIDPTDTNLIYFAGGGVNNFYKSTDGGETWSLKNTGIVGYSFIVYLTIDPVNSNILYLSGYSGAVHKSTDYGETWFFSGIGLPVQTEAIAIDYTDPDILYATGGIYHGGSGVYKSTDRGVTWFRKINGFPPNIPYPYVRSIVMDPTNPGILYIGGYPIWSLFSIGVYKTTDAGDTWVEKSNGLTSDIVRALAINPSDPDILYTSTPAGLFKTVDAGDNWEITLEDTLVFSLAIDPTNPNRVYVGTIGPPVKIYKSTDDGVTWTSASISDEDTAVICIAVAPANPNIVYVGTEGAHVYKSTDAGQTWQEKSNGLPQLNDPPFWRYPKMYRIDAPEGVNSLAIDSYNSNLVYAGVCYDEGSIYKTTNGGESWEVMNNGYAGYSPQTLVIDPADRTTVYAGSYGGVWTYTNSGTLEPIPELKKAIAYANPARGNHVVFAYQLNFNAEVTLRLYNLVKELVASVTEQKLAGDCVTRLDISNIPAGVYLYQITTEDAATGEIEHWERQKLAIIR